jgi:hypothetical protein
MDVDDSRGKPISDEIFVLTFNAHRQKLSFQSPKDNGSRQDGAYP